MLKKKWGKEGQMFSYLFNGERMLLISAVAPAIALMIYIYKKDKLEKEPRRLLVSLVILGIVSTFIAMLTETLGENILNGMAVKNELYYRFLMYFCVVAVSEEGVKYLFLRIRTWNNPAFNCRFDGVVYAVFVSLGFALFENIMYVFNYGFATALVRAVFSIPGHTCFAVVMGVFYGIAKQLQVDLRRALSFVMRVLSLFFAVIFHGAYDFFATMEGTDYDWSFYVFYIVMFAICFILVKKTSKADGYFRLQKIYYD